MKTQLPLCLLSVLLIAACSDEQPDGGVDLSPAAPAATLAEQPPVSGGAMSSAALTSEVAPQAGCSIVEYCNVPNSPDGTRCFHQRCETDAAIAECRREVRRICGRPKCNFVFIDFDGERIPLFPCDP
jgi:hypothetical protein